MDHGACSYRRFLEGDESAFDEIMEAYFQGLVYFLCRYVGDMTVAEDLAIDTFCDLVVHRHRYNFKVSLKTYLYLVGRSRALSYLRTRKNKGFLPLSEAVPIPDTGEGPEEMVMRREREEGVRKALSELPLPMREAVHLVYFEDLSYDQAARVMKKSRKQVDNLLYRAKKELCRLLRKEGDLF